MAESPISPNESPKSADEISLAPVEGFSPQEREFRARFYPPIADPVVLESGWRQFTIRQWMGFTFIAGIGLAGGSWASAQDYAGYLGCLWVCLFFLRAFVKPELPFYDTALWSVGLAYGCATLRAIIVSSFHPLP